CLMFIMLIRFQPLFQCSVVVTQQPNRPQMFSGESITLTCEVQGGETTGWTCEWRRDGSIIHRTNSKDWTFRVSRSSSGDYMCQCRSRDDWYSTTQWSETIRLSVSGELCLLFIESRVESITLTCEVQGGETTQWTCDWRTPWTAIYRTNSKDWTFIVSESSRENYMCQCRSRDDWYSSTQWSETIRLSVSGKPKAQLNSNSREIPAGGRVTLTCIVDSSSSGWKYFWYKERDSSEPLTREEAVFPSNGQMSVSEEGLYWCRGGRGRPVYYTDYSDRISITKNGELNVTREKVTLRCEIQGGTEWTYEWRSTNGNFPSSSEYSINYITESHSGDYSCRGNRNFELTEWSDAVRLTVIYPRPAASLSVNPDRVQHFRSDSVSLSCEGNSTEWRVMRFIERDGLSDCSYWGTMTGSTCTINPYYYRDGVFWCESKSGEFSNAVNITEHDDDHDGVILVSPVHPVTEGDPVTLSCRDKKQNLLSNVFFYHNNKLINNDGREELKISAVSKSDEGFYKCQHSGKESPRSWMSVRVLCFMVRLTLNIFMINWNVICLFGCFCASLQKTFCA
uniref:Ig-like domain-containing protein n=1 Tax=Xiphophorus maculatus TaxID=8083 RepID=A0A3B5Q7M7_XIPMA